MPPGGPVGMRGPNRFLTEEEKKNRPQITKALLKRIFSYLLPYWPKLLLVLAAIILVVDFWAFAIHPHRKDHRRRADWRGFRRTAGADRLIVCRAGPFQPDRRTGKLSEYLGSAAYYLRYA